MKMSESAIYELAPSMALKPVMDSNVQWEPGQKCEFCNLSDQKWVKGKVIEMVKDDKGDWIKVRWPDDQ